jgi:hypothetical protein
MALAVTSGIPVINDRFRMGQVFALRIQQLQAAIINQIGILITNRLGDESLFEQLASMLFVFLI